MEIVLPRTILSYKDKLYKNVSWNAHVISLDLYSLLISFTSNSPILISPFDGLYKPSNNFKSVLFPEPLRPIIATELPNGISNVRFSKALLELL